jgi:signal transduction histidine kinase
MLDPADLLHQAAEAFSHSSPQEATVFIDIKNGSPLPPLWVDREQILAVLGELIDNAAKASGGQVQIHLSAEPDEMNSAVFVEVRDTGPGMDEQTIARAYTPFFSGQKAGRRRGLGLPKAKRFVEINGGKLWIDSTVGEGTAVCLQLPVAMQSSDHEVES